MSNSPRLTLLMVAAVALLGFTASLLSASVLVTTTAIAAQQRKAPATKAQQSPGTAQQRQPSCYPATTYAPSQTTMTGNYLCTGKVVVLRGGRRVCLLCGIGPPQIGDKCASCKSGYVFHKWGHKCCKGSTSPSQGPK